MSELIDVGGLNPPKMTTNRVVIVMKPKSHVLAIAVLVSPGTILSFVLIFTPTGRITCPKTVSSNAVEPQAMKIDVIIGISLSNCGPSLRKIIKQTETANVNANIVEATR